MVACLTQIICFLGWEILRCSQAGLENRKAETQREEGNGQIMTRTLLLPHWLPWIGITPNDERKKLEIFSFWQRGFCGKSIHRSFGAYVLLKKKKSHHNHQPDLSKCSQQLAPRDKAEVFHSLILIIFEHFKENWTRVFFSIMFIFKFKARTCYTYERSSWV